MEWKSKQTTTEATAAFKTIVVLLKTMTKLQYLNTYMTERLMTTAEDILQVIRETIQEFLEEINRTKSENQYLRRQLAASNERGQQAQQQTLWVRVVPPPHEKQQRELQDKSPGAVVREEDPPPRPPQIKEELNLRACRNEKKPPEPPANTGCSSDLSSSCVYGTTTDNGIAPQKQQPDQTPPVNTEELCDFEITDQFKTETQQEEEYGESKTINSIYESEPLAPPVGAQCSRTQSECTPERALPPTNHQRDWKGQPRPEEDLTMHSAHSNNSSSDPQSVECIESSLASQQQYLTYHMQSLNEKLGSSLCNICGKTFSSLGKLKEHQRLHTGERPYCCEFCGKRFNQNCNLKVHVRVHTGEKPYPCPVCGKGFSQSSQVKMHLRTHR